MNLVRRLGGAARCAKMRAVRFAERRRLVCLAFAAGFGAFLTNVLSLPLIVAVALAGLFLAAAIGLKKCKHEGSFGCLLLVLMLVFFAYAQEKAVQPTDRTARRGEMMGVICEEAVAQTDNRRIVMTLKNVTCDGDEITGRVRLYVYGTTDVALFMRGDRICVQNASLTIPKGQTNPGGFDFAAYLWRRGVAYCASGSLANIEIIESRASVSRMLSVVRRTLAEKVDALYGENADVMRAILLGDRSQMTDETYDDFRNAGIAHLIALSGLHVTCIAVLLGFFLRGLLIPRKISAFITVAILCLYADMTGGSASVVRAVMMYALFCLGRENGYPDDVLTRLAFAFLVQMAWNPLLMWETGFQLSYLSVLALCCLTGLMRLLLGEKENEGLFCSLVKDACAASCVAQAATLPLICSLFYSVPMLALPINLITVPMGLVAVFTGAGSLALAFVNMPLAKMLALPGQGIWLLIKWLTGWFTRLPFAVVAAKSWPLALGCAYFIMVLMLSPYVGLKEKYRKWGALLMPVICAIVFLLPREVPDGVRITFLDVNYGDSAVIDVGADTYVVDCGHDNGILCDYLTSSGARVRGVFLSHPDLDHAGAITELLRRWNYATVYLPECWDRMDVSTELDEALNLVHVKYLAAGDSVPLGMDAVAEVLWPPEDFLPKEDNDGCLVVRISYGEASALFMADVTDQFDAFAAAESDILKVAHHGSRYATTSEMLAIAQPEYAVISVANNNYGHPTQEVLDRLNAIHARVYRTDECGAIRMDLQKTGEIRIQTMLSPEGIK